MKYLWILFLVTGVLSAQEEIKESQLEKSVQKLTIGLGPYVQTQPYVGKPNPIVVPSPVIFYDNGIVYIRWSRAGVYFLGNKGDDFSWGFSITGQPRVNQLDPSHSEKLKGIKERKSTLEAGLAFSATYKDAYIESMLLTDMLGRYDSWLFKTEIGYDFTLGKFSFYPSTVLVYLSDEYVNYYYGVSKQESIDSSFAQYTPNGGLTVGIQTYIKYPFTQNFAALLNIRADTLTQAAYDSPLVDSSFIYSGLASLIYTFQY